MSCRASFPLLQGSLLLTFSSLPPSPLPIHSPTSISLETWHAQTAFLCRLPSPEGGTSLEPYSTHDLLRLTSLRGMHLRLALPFHHPFLSFPFSYFVFIPPLPSSLPPPFSFFLFFFSFSFRKQGFLRSPGWP